jgi:hypothetical protein
MKLVALGVTMLAFAGGLGASARAQAADPAPAPATAAATPAPAQAAPASVPAVAAAPQGGSIKGTVKASGVPLPGVSVTATNTLTGKKYATTTDIDGAYEMAVPRNGRYVVKTELTGFASVTQEVMVNASSESGGLPKQTAEFKMDLASRVTPAPAAADTAVAGATTPARTGATAARTTSGAVARVGRGTQALAVEGTDDSEQADATANEGNTGAQLPSLASLGDDNGSAAASESIAVSGQQGMTNGLAGFSQEDIQNRIQDMQRNGFNNGDIAGAMTGVMQSGSFGGPNGGPGGNGFGPPGGGPGGGGGGGGGGGRGGGGGGGGFRGGGGGGGGFGGGGFAAFRGQNPNAWHGSFAYNGSNSALDAIPFSVTGNAVPKPPSDTNTLIGSVTGTPYIPHLMAANPKQFLFFSVQEMRNTRSTISNQTVPTLAQRLGDLTPAFQAQQVIAGQQYFDPNTGALYSATGCDARLAAIDASPTACIPSSELNANPAAQALLNYYPLPNITPLGASYNYQTITQAQNHQSQISGRYNRSFGATPARGQGRFNRGQNRNAPPALRQSIAENFAYSHLASSSQNFSPLLGGSTVTDGYSFTSSYTVGYGRLNSSASLGWNRSRNTASNYFTNGLANPAATAGIFVANPTIYNNPFYFGVPSIGLTGLSGLSDSTPSNTINQTISFSDFVSWSHKRHNMRFGVDFRRIHADTIGGTNVLGGFTFSGFATENPLLQSCNPNTDAQRCAQYGTSGSPVADLLLGLPQQTKITADPNKIYLRGNSWDWYAQDDWRARSNITIAYGLRWEYFSPYSEKYNRLVNLNLTGSGTGLQIANVCATTATGCASVGSPSSLVYPDKALFSPRIAIAWQPKFKWTKSMVVRSGYGINYNTGQYSRFATNLSAQQPFAITQTNTLYTPTSSTTCLLPSQTGTLQGKAMTLANGFNCSTQTTQSNFGVDPHYRLGMVQVYNLGIQRTLPQGVVLNIDYTGAYAGNLDMLRAPNRNASGILNPSSGQFTFEDSLGYQRSNALAVNARERMHKGVSLQATYTFAHSIDDASSVGGSGNSIAQNDQDLGAEESNSSFVRRHTLSGNFVIEPPFGPNRAFFNKGGVVSKILDGYSISGTFTFASGSFGTPTYSNTAAEIAAGAASSLRPNRVAGQAISGAGTLKSWFNTAAFSTPSPGTYGNASRNSIVMPGTVSINGSLSRTISLGETRNLEMRITAGNALNTVQYSGVNTTINSPQYGQVTGAAAMRSFTYQARYRF